MNLSIINPKPNLETVRQINDLYLRTWVSTYPNKEKNITEDLVRKFFSKFNTKDNYKKTVKYLKNIPDNQKYIIAKDGNKIIGVCTARINDDTNELVTIYIDPEYQGKGIGGKLWGELQSFFDSKKNVLVKVFEHNSKAINFYEKLGFKDTRERICDKRFTFENGVTLTEVVMIKGKK